MSLQVWLPLTEDLHNQGIDGSITISGGTKQISGGKISNVHYTGGISVSYGNGLPSRGTSVAFWIKPTTVSGWNNYFEFSYDDGNRRFYIATNNNHIYPAYGASGHEGTTTLEVGKWYHIALISYSDGTFKAYLNGKLETSIGQQADFNFGGNAYFANNASFNDIRIYDHALSDNEVYEISKGLVLHYTLSLNSIVNRNLLGTDSIPNDITINVGLYYTPIKRSSNFFGLLAGDTFSVSYYLTCPSVKGGSLRILYYTDGNNRTSVYGTSIAAGQSGLVTYTGTLTANQRAYNEMWICIQNGDTSITSTDPFHVQYLKIEKGNTNTPYTTSTISTMYDCSGYLNNGILPSNVNLVNGGPRYSKHALIKGIITTNNLNIPDGPCTLAFWVKQTNYADGVDTSKIQINFAKCGFFTYINYPYFIHDTDCKYKYTNYWADGKWHHVACVYDGTTNKIYIDGSSISLSTSTKTRPYVSNLSALFTDNSVSDFRLYTTALSESDIQDLYSLGALISA